MRRPLIIGNWKLHGSKQLVASLINELQQQLASKPVNCDIAIAPPVLFLDQATHLLGPASSLALAVQNVDLHDSGAFTGEIAASMLPEFAVQYVIIGHSERRCYHQESNSVIAEKFIQVKRAGLTPVLCLGETSEQRARGETERICSEQLAQIVRQAGAAALQNSAIAYEPIWAIGSGQAATAEQAQAVHHYLRRFLVQQDATLASSMRLLYGGSVSENNASNLYSMPDIDGFLVGGASLQARSFATIIRQMVDNKAKTL
ncbi:MAG: triose-phosphate isomerase [Candidatus Symbiodolus clandestinus]